MAKLELDGLTKIYANGVRALHELCLQVADGEWLVLVGPSGCGKTTSLRLIAGLEEATGGTIGVDGRIVNDMPADRRNVGMVVQRPALFPNKTVRDNLNFATRLRRGWFSAGASHLETAQDLTDLLELRELSDRYPGQLSAGQQQRVALGRALSRKAAVYLLDEPLSHVDVPQRLELRRKLHLLRPRVPATMLYVTHDPAEALALGDRIAVLDQGTLLQVGSPEDLCRRPAHRRVAELLSPGSAVSFVEGTLVEAENGLILAGSGGELPVPAHWRDLVGREVVLGVRAENVRLDASGSDPRSGLKMEISFVEGQGDKHLVTCRTENWQITGLNLGPGHRMVVGQKVMIAINCSDTLVFDGHTGQALSLSG